MRDKPFIKGITDDDLSRIGITSFGYIRTDEISFSDDVRSYCEGDNGCHNFGRSWACPPAVGTVAECREKCLGYPHALVFASTYKLEDSFDFAAMSQGHRSFKKVCDDLYEILEQPFLLLSNEGCLRCKECTYPTSPCRFPERLFPSLEGYGIWVNELAKSAGMRYNNGPNTVTYFGLVCYG